MSNPDWQKIEEHGLRKWIFANFTGCSNHGCVVHGKSKGMGKNGHCHCLVNASRAQLASLGCRLNSLLVKLEAET